MSLANLPNLVQTISTVLFCYNDAIRGLFVEVALWLYPYELVLIAKSLDKQRGKMSKLKRLQDTKN